MPDGSDARRLTDHGPQLPTSIPQFSPDGAFITYGSAENGVAGLSIIAMATDGSDPEVLVDGEVLGFSWQPVPDPTSDVPQQTERDRTHQMGSMKTSGSGSPSATSRASPAVFAPGVDGHGLRGDEDRATSGAPRLGDGLQSSPSTCTGDGVADRRSDRSSATRSARRSRRPTSTATGPTSCSSRTSSSPSRVSGSTTCGRSRPEVVARDGRAAGIPGRRDSTPGPSRSSGSAATRSTRTRSAARTPPGRPRPDPDLRVPGAGRLAGLRLAGDRDVVRAQCRRDRSRRRPRRTFEEPVGPGPPSFARATAALRRPPPARSAAGLAVSASTSSFRTSMPRSVGISAPSSVAGADRSRGTAATFSGSTHDDGTPSRIRRRRNTSSR